MSWYALAYPTNFNQLLGRYSLSLASRCFAVTWLNSIGHSSSLMITKLSKISKDLNNIYHWFSDLKYLIHKSIPYKILNNNERHVQLLQIILVHVESHLNKSFDFPFLSHWLWKWFLKILQDFIWEIQLYLK